ncbi:hypothetical protein PFISCL1PPCAC_3090, partial [Pristionchus fissidentatus]
DMSRNDQSITRRSLEPTVDSRKNAEPSGVIRFELGLDQNFETHRSEKVQIEGLPWNVYVKKSNLAPSFEYLSLFVTCNPNSSTMWSCRASIEIGIIKANGERYEKLIFSWNFNNKVDDVGFHAFLSWNFMMDPQKNFIRDGKVTIEARIFVEETTGVRTTVLLFRTTAWAP